MIPKVIHYCWFGRGEMPTTAVNCIESWRKFLPDYKFQLWNEENFDVESTSYTKEAYESKKFAFVTDYVRLYVLYHFGGIYMDTDVEVLKSLDSFLIHPAFSGFEDDNFVPTGIMGSVRESLWVGDLLGDYKARNFIIKDGTLDTTTNTAVITDKMIKKGLVLNNEYQTVNGEVVFYPKDYFCPKSYKTGEINLTVNSYCIHHFAKSWVDPKFQRLTNFKHRLISVFGSKLVSKTINIFRLDKLKLKM